MRVSPPGCMIPSRGKALADRAHGGKGEVALTRQPDDFAQVAEGLRLLGHPIRLRLLHLLRQAGELCVGDLCDVLRLPQSTASRHLALLREGKLVALRQVGLWVFYRPVDSSDPVHPSLGEWLERSLAGLPQAREDVRRLEQRRRQGGCCSPVVDPAIIPVPTLVPRTRAGARRPARVTASSRDLRSPATRR
jgi:ArsR family transcriptional regulator